jgi:hypothetical protein
VAPAGAVAIGGVALGVAVRVTGRATMPAEAVLLLAGALGRVNGELGLAARRRLGAGQLRKGGADQPAVDRALELRRPALGGYRRRLRIGLGDGDGDRFLVFAFSLRRHYPRQAVEDLLIKGSRHVFLLSLRRYPGLLELVFGVAGGAPCLFDLVAHHGDDGVVGDPALARTVIVHDIPESRLALLHQAP